MARTKSNADATALAGLMLQNWKLGADSVKRLAEMSDPMKADLLAATWHPKQARVAQDKHRKIAVLCPRRAGKSYMAYTLAFERCFRHHKQIWYIIGDTLPSIKRIYWDIFREIDQKENLGLHFHETKGRITFKNGSIINLAGANDSKELAKLRGTEMDGAIIDECANFIPHIFRKLVDDVLSFALGTRLGQLYLIGTPGDNLTGPFYEATCPEPVITRGGNGKEYSSNRHVDTPHDGRINKWSLHTWTAQDNTSPAGRNSWAEMLANKEQNGWADDHPVWRREALGQWVQSDSLYVYKFKEHLHLYEGPAPGFRDSDRKEDIFYVAGADFGLKDGFAYVIWGWNRYERKLYEVASEKHKNLTNSQRVAMIRRMEGKLNGTLIKRVGDPGGGGLDNMHTLRVEHEIPMEVAEKTKKRDAIQSFNDNLDEGLILLRPDSPLWEEMAGNRWEEKTIDTHRQRESDSTPNDLCDAALYSFREAQHRWAEARPEEARALSESEVRYQKFLESKRLKRQRAEEVWSEDDHWDVN